MMDNISQSLLSIQKFKSLLNNLCPCKNRAVPDPYYKGGFQSVYDMIEVSIDAMIKAYS